MSYDIGSLAYGFTTEQADIISLPLTYQQYIFERESTYEENYYGKIDAWWRVRDTLYPTDAKSDRKVNRNDDESSGIISTAEFVGISGHRGSIHGRSVHMDLRYKGTSFKKFKRQKLVDLCHTCQLNTPQEAIRKLPYKSIEPNLFYYRAEHPGELLFNFLWSKALELPYRSYNIPDEFLVKEARFLGHIKSLPKTTWKMNDYGYDLRTIKKKWGSNEW
jgi:hypothetical protein